jgi:hypothetical protein
MKKLLTVVLALTLSTVAFAEPFRPGPDRGGHGGHWVQHGSGWHWIVPAVIGGVLTYEIVKSQEQRPVIITEPPVIVQQPPVVIQRQPVCTEWREYTGPDGRVYRERTCQP